MVPTRLLRICHPALLALAACVPTVVMAETQSTFQVSATIESGCLVDGVGTSGDAGTIGELDFGQDSALSTATHTADATATQSITLRCTPGVALQMRIDGGQHAEGGNRHLQFDDPSNRVEYQIFRDSAFTQPIGINQNQSITVTTGNMNNVILPVYGRLTLPGNRPTGTYSDALLVTLDW